MRPSDGAESGRATETVPGRDFGPRADPTDGGLLPTVRVDPEHRLGLGGRGSHHDDRAVRGQTTPARVTQGCSTTDIVQPPPRGPSRSGGPGADQVVATVPPHPGGDRPVVQLGEGGLAERPVGAVELGLQIDQWRPRRGLRRCPAGHLQAQEAGASR